MWISTNSRFTPYRLLVKNNQTYIYPEPNGYWVMGRNFAALEYHEGILMSLAITAVVIATIIKLCRLCFSRITDTGDGGPFEGSEGSDMNECLVNTEVVYEDYDATGVSGGCQDVLQDTTFV